MVRCFGGWRPLLLYDSMSGAVSRGDTYLSETHCKLRRSAAVGQASLHPLLVPQSGTDYHPQHHTGCVSPPLRGTIFRWRCSTYPQLRCFAACSGFHYIGPAPRNPYKTATFVTSFICYVVSLRSIHTLISFDTHIHIVRYTHSYRTM